MINTIPKRLKALAAVLLLISASTLGAVGTTAAISGSDSAGSEIYSSNILEHASWNGFDTSGDVLTHGVDGYPGWIVRYSEEENGSSALQSWSAGSSERKILYHDSESNWMLLTAPSEHIGVSGYYRTAGKYFSTKLSQRSYVETVGLNMQVERVEPVSNLANKTEFSKPKAGSWATLGGTQGSFDQTGVAYEDDANRSSMQEATQAVSADSTGVSGSGIKVAVLDTGLTYNKSLYGDRVVAGKNTVSNETVNISRDADGSINITESDYSAVEDGNGHGSFVTAQIAANGSGSKYDGVAPQSSIIPVKVLGDDGSGSTAAIAHGIEYACSQGADVISMSLGGYAPQEIIKDEISECYQEDGLSAAVIAVGNERQSARWQATPSDYSTELPIIAVAATNSSTPENAEVAYFSNVGPDPLRNGAAPTVAAPGMKIVTKTDSGVKELSGTSMATPIVSGVIVQLVDAKASLQGDEQKIRDRVERTASPIPSAGVTEVGSGMIHAQHLISNTEPAQTQADARTEEARARDSANRALSGSMLRELLEGT